MQRREFLRLSAHGESMVGEIACDKLYVQWRDTVSHHQHGMSEQGTLNDSEWWAGEPALHTSQQSPEEFFQSVLRELMPLESVKVSALEWFSDDEFRIRVQHLLQTFQTGGGTVIYEDQKAVDAQVVSK